MLGAFVLRLLINTGAVAAAAALIPGIQTEGGLLTYLIVGLLFGLVNSVIKPVALVVSCPLNIITLGLFTLVVNAAMFALTSWLVQTVAPLLGLPARFVIEDFWSAFLGAIIASIVSLILSSLLRPDAERRRERDR